MFNALHDDLAFFKKAAECHKETCYAGCDVDWTKKFILKDDFYTEIDAVVETVNPGKGAIWNSQSLEQSQHTLAHIVWAPTLLCNYNCAYCGCSANRAATEKKFISAMPELDAGQWLIVWRKLLDYFDYAIITMAGGEPMLSDAVLPVFDLISHKFSIFLTSNLSRGIMALSRRRPCAETYTVEGLGTLDTGLSYITASLHPSAKGFNEQMFKGAVLLLKQNGYTVAVNFVGYPPQLYLATEWKSWCALNEIPFTLSPWCGRDRDGFLASYSPAERVFVDSIAPPHRKTSTQLVFKKTAYTMVTDQEHYTTDAEEQRVSGVLTNTGDYVWQKMQDGKPLRIGFKIKQSPESPTIKDFRVDFPVDELAPGESTTFTLNLKKSDIGAGSYIVVIDVIREGAFWMESKGAQPKRIFIDFL